MTEVGDRITTMAEEKVPHTTFISQLKSFLDLFISTPLIPFPPPPSCIPQHSTGSAKNTPDHTEVSSSSRNHGAVVSPTANVNPAFNFLIGDMQLNPRFPSHGSKSRA